jgi:glutamine synthetase
LNGLNRLLEKFTPVVATEIEFYLHNASQHFASEQVVNLIWEECGKAGIILASVDQERGPDQYEIALKPSYNIKKISTDTERFKVLAKKIFAGHAETDFSAKPLLNAPGSGLHVHVHLEDITGKNIFFREGEEFSSPLLYAIGGLLTKMAEHMIIFAPTEASYSRFSANSNAPTTISWGTNNRTVAIRLPTKPMDNKHIEHRVAGSDADIAKVIDSILVGIEYGILNECNPGEAIYGDASLAQYALQKLPQTLEEAKKYSIPI